MHSKIKAFFITWCNCRVKSNLDGIQLSKMLKTADTLATDTLATDTLAQTGFIDR